MSFYLPMASVSWTCCYCCSVARQNRPIIPHRRHPRRQVCSSPRSPRVGHLHPLRNFFLVGPGSLVAAPAIHPRHRRRSHHPLNPPPNRSPAHPPKSKTFSYLSLRYQW
ncbi:hypothetical protein M5D96_011141, partial [Drosophila gunungcola]